MKETKNLKEYKNLQKLTKANKFYCFTLKMKYD